MTQLWACAESPKPQLAIFMSGSTFKLVLVNRSRKPARLDSLGLELSAFALTQAVRLTFTGTTTSAGAFAPRLARIARWLRLYSNLTPSTAMLRILRAFTSGTPPPAAALPRLSHVLPTRSRSITPTPPPPAIAYASPRQAAATTATTSTP
jgi:hypothetical protein